jgi:hypothetical protein
MARKWQQFADAVGADPVDYLNRVASRFLCATVWYESSAPAQDSRRPWLVRLNRCLHPVPFLALVILLFTGMQRRLRAIEWAVIGVYLLCLLPYVAVSYYDRYALPLLGVKVLLVTWGAERLASGLVDKRVSPRTRSEGPQRPPACRPPQHGSSPRG